MSDLHALRIEGEKRAAHEAVSAEFLKEKLLWAREQSWSLFRDIQSELQIGMSEKEAFRMAMRLSEERGVSKHWHKPFVRFGAGTVLSFRDPLLDESRLQKNDAVYIDLGPVWQDPETDLEYEGDVGDSFAFGENVDYENMAETARELFGEARALWLKEKVSGVQMYSFLLSEAQARGYELVEKIDGHRVSDFPHHKYSRERLSQLSFDPAPLLWVLEVQICNQERSRGAFFEDVLM